MRRREFVTRVGGAALALPLALRAQQSGKTHRIGFLTTNAASAMGGLMEAFAGGLSALGYAEGKNILVERRYADGQLERLPALAADLVERKVDLILSANTLTTIAAKQATRTIPIVFLLVSDPVGSGIVASLARPGGNATGMTQSAPELTAKRLQILKQAYPKVSRVAVFVSNDSVVKVQLPGVEQAARVLRMETLPIDLRSREEFATVQAILRKWQADSLYCLETPFAFNNRQLMAEFAVAARLPAIYAEREYAQSGGLMSYGSKYTAIYRRAAAYVDKILKGARPADLPVELPTQFELVVRMERPGNAAYDFVLL